MVITEYSPNIPFSIDCGICGKGIEPDMGFCPRCRGGGLERGGLLNGEEPYVPLWHYREYSDIDV